MGAATLNTKTRRLGAQNHPRAAVAIACDGDAVPTRQFLPAGGISVLAYVRGRSCKHLKLLTKHHGTWLAAAISDDGYRPNCIASSEHELEIGHGYFRRVEYRGVWSAGPIVRAAEHIRQHRQLADHGFQGNRL